MVWDSLQANPDKIWTYEERLSFIFNQTPVHEAGKSWAYSDSNYLLIGMLIEEITNSPYYDEVYPRILRKEGLTTTYPGDTREIPNLSGGYSKLDAFFRMPEKMVVDGKYAFNPQMEWTGGGFASTTSDLAKWAKAYYEAKYFSTESLNQIVTPNKNALDLGGETAYGMGSFIFGSKHGKMYGHTGFVPGFLSVFGYFPESKTAVALQVNCDYATEKMSLNAYLYKILEVVEMNVSKE